MTDERKNVYVPASIHKEAKLYALEHDETMGEFVARAIQQAMQQGRCTKLEPGEETGKRHEAEPPRSGGSKSVGVYRNPSA